MTFYKDLKVYICDYFFQDNKAITSFFFISDAI